jgi:hypothetical protein
MNVREEMMGGYRRLHGEVLSDVYSFPTFAG